MKLKSDLAEISTPSPATSVYDTLEHKTLRKMSPEAKAEWNKVKMQAILDRKEAARKICEKKKGRAMKIRTVTTILNPDTNTADIFVFEGAHLRIAWNSEEAKRSYKGSYVYKA